MGYKKYDNKVQGLSLNAQRILEILGETKATDKMTMARLTELADEVEILPENIPFILQALERRGLIKISGGLIDLIAL
jgi:DNA-binding MarR family transcriptional regulator